MLFDFSPLFWLSVFLSAGVAARAIADALFSPVVMAATLAGSALIVGVRRFAVQAHIEGRGLLRESAICAATTLAVTIIFLFVR
jgi:hypothetical protein